MLWKIVSAVPASSEILLTVEMRVADADTEPFETVTASASWDATAEGASAVAAEAARLSQKRYDNIQAELARAATQLATAQATALLLPGLSGEAIKES